MVTSTNTTDPQTPPAVTVVGVRFAYDIEPVLENVSIRIPRGDFACLVGPNGGGKSTLLKLMVGLLRPQAGAVRVFDQPPAKIRSRIGYAPQSPQMDLRFPATVRDVVLMGRLPAARSFGAFARSDRNAAEEALAAVGLGDLRKRPFGGLSGGQRQRVLIARALVGDPEILMLDEPTSGLDIGAGQQLYELLADLNRRMTVVVVSHDVGFVSSYVRQVVCVHRTVAIHPTEAWNDEMVSDLYGGSVRRVLHEHDCIEKGCEEGGHQH